MFRISTSVLTKRFDLLDVVFFTVMWFLTGTMIALGESMWLIFSVILVGNLIYISAFLIITYIRHLCHGRITNTDPFYGGTE